MMFVKEKQMVERLKLLYQYMLFSIVNIQKFCMKGKYHAESANHTR